MITLLVTIPLDDYEDKECEAARLLQIIADDVRTSNFDLVASEHVYKRVPGDEKLLWRWKALVE